LQFSDQMGGGGATCKYCGSVVSVPPKDAPVARAAQVRSTSRPQPKGANRRAQAFCGVYLILACGFAATGYAVGDNGSPASLSLFVLGFLFSLLSFGLLGMTQYDSGLLSQWIKVDLTVPLAAGVFIPAGLLFALAAFITYSP